MNKIVLISPIRDITRIAKKVVQDNNFNVDVIMGDLSEGVKAAKKYEELGCKVFISRGGTYNMIKSAVKSPVVEIKINAYDILRAFRNLISYKGKIGIVGYENIISGCEIIGELLHLDIEKIIISRETDAFQIIKNASDDGIKCFVGDSISYKCAKKLGNKSYLIKSGVESIKDAINEAIRIRIASKNEEARAKELKTIIDFAHDGIIAVNEEGKISILNSSAKKVFNLKSDDVIGKSARDCIPNMAMDRVLKTGIPELGEIQDVNKNKVAANRIPIIVDGKTEGVVATFQDITQIQDLEKKIRANLARKGFTAKYNFNSIIYKSRSIGECIDIAKKYSSIESPVLILGQSGTGKELFAQSIHNMSSRRNGPFVAVNCSSFPESLLESELFGYAEGSFTGAKKGGKAGLFEQAHKGTIFLDEIGDLPFNFQARILRVLQEKEVMRIGDDKVIPIDIRVISATHKNIFEMIENGEFREDLFYRINVLPLEIPPLNERREDIPVLANFFLKHYSGKFSKLINNIEKDAMEYLYNYDYRGNVRELRGIVERSAALCSGNTIKIEDVRFKSRYKDQNELDGTIEYMENKYINKVLKQCNGNITAAAGVLGINRSTLWRKINSK